MPIDSNKYLLWPLIVQKKRRKGARVIFCLKQQFTLAPFFGPIFRFNFDAWRLPESNEIPRQGLRTDLDYEMQNLIQAMGSFKACREQRIAADGPAVSWT